MLRIALAQMRVVPGFPDRNAETMLRMIADAQRQHADLVIFPEMAIPGYLIGDAWEQTAFVEECEACGEEIIAASRGIAVIFGNVAVDWAKKNNDGRPRKYNAFFTAQDGRLVPPGGMPYPFVVKTLMPNYREFDDTRHFFSLQKLAREIGVPAESLLAPVRLAVRGKTYAVGCLLCEDGWSDDYALSPMDVLRKNGTPDFFVNISSSPYTLGKGEKRRRLFGRRAAGAGVPLLYVNSVGIQNNGKTVYTFDGANAAYDGRGAVRVAGAPYAETMQVFDLETLHERPAVPAVAEPESAQVFRALSYGVRLFLESIGMERVVIGVSGGIDSAVAAALYARVLPPENILLVNMPSRYNSGTTRGLARRLAENLGCRYAVVPIQASVELTARQIEETAVENLFDGTETRLRVSPLMAENIQARDRSARVLAALAASFGGGFTCNANKAETAVGYSTLYGDQSGFLAALADLWKHQVYGLARYLNEAVYGREAIPGETLDIVPSAELSDAQDVDKGQGDPLRYPYHDYLFRAFVERWQKASPQDILAWYAEGTLEENIGCGRGLVAACFPTAKDFIDDLERWWNQFSGLAVAKRIQAPPILAVSRRAFGFDHREAQNGPYYTRKYRALKARLLGQ